MFDVVVCVGFVNGVFEDSFDEMVVVVEEFYLGMINFDIGNGYIDEIIGMLLLILCDKFECKVVLFGGKVVWVCVVGCLFWWFV